MAQTPDHDRLDEQAERIRHAEEEAGLKPAATNPEDVTLQTTRRGYRVGTDFVVSVLTFIALGWLVDWAFDTAPWGIVILMLVGFGVGMMNLWRALNGSDGESNGKAQKE